MRVEIQPVLSSTELKYTIPVLAMCGIKKHLVEKLFFKKKTFDAPNKMLMIVVYLEHLNLNAESK